ncbi:MAG: FAD-dependent oxidoreductase [Gemmatales bacterium]
MHNVIIIGAGVIGCTAAYYLRKAGCDVTLIDQKTLGSGASHGNCGYICPSHVLPLAGPGVMGNTMKAMLAPDSPFSVRPGFNTALWGWLLQFAKRCNARHMMQAAPAIHALLQSSRQLYPALIEAEQFDVDWQTKGILFAFQTEKAHHHYAETDALLRQHFGVGAERYDGDAVNKLEPALKPGLAGGWRYTGDAQLRPDRLMACWREWLLKNGVTIHENQPVSGFLAEGNQLRGVKTASGEHRGSHVIVATGAWTPMLNRVLHCKVPIQPGKGYSLTMTRPSICPSLSLIFEEHRVAVTPFRDGYRLGSIMEFAGYDASHNPKRVELLRSGARHYLQEPCGPAVTEEWWGWRPMTYDSVPIIGPLPAFRNGYLATGHSMLGLSQATGTGKLITELVLGEKPHLDPQPYSVTRFG